MHRRAAGIFVAATVAGLWAPARADLPFGWSVEIFAGRVLDLAPGGGVLACASDGGVLFFELATGEFRQIADAGCTSGRCLRSNRLSSVARDSRGRYWLGTQSAGVTLLRPEAGGPSYEHFFAANFRPGGGLLSDSVSAVATWGDEAVYAATPSGVAQIDVAGEVGEYNPDSSRQRGVEGFPDAAVVDVAVDAVWVWAATTSTIVRYRRLPPHDVETLGDSLAGTRVRAVTIQHGQVWAGTDVAVLRWNETGRYWQRLRNEGGSPQPTPSFDAYAIVVRDPDLVRPRVAVGAANDVWSFNGFAWGRCNPPAYFLLENRVFRAMVATGDTLWTAQSNQNGEGAFLESWVTVQGCAWGHHEPSSIPAGPVRAVDIQSGSRDMWIGTQLSGVARRSTGGWCVYNINDPDVVGNMTHGDVSAFLVDRDAKVWFTTLPLGAQAPLDVLRGDPSCNHADDLWEHIVPGQGGFGGRYWRIVEDGAGNRFFLSDGHEVSPGGLEVLGADGSDTLNLRADLLGGRTVGSIAFDRATGVWQRAYVGVNNRGDQGLLEWLVSNDLFTPTAANFVTLPLRFADNSTFNVSEFRDLAFDPGRGELWIGTGQGLLRYSTGRRRIERLIETKTLSAPGLLSLDVRDLLLDGRGNLWIGTDEGLNRIAVGDSFLAVDAFTTRESIDELNQAGMGAILYLPERTLAPLPDPRVRSLDFDAMANLLYIATNGGVAALDVAALDVRPVVPIDKAVLYPNPVRALGTEDAVYLGDATLPATVTVYNLEGEIVSEKLVTAPGVEAWDLRIIINSSGGTVRFFEAASGVYMVRVTNAAGTKVAPLVVIR